MRKGGEMGMTAQEKRERVIKGLECCLLDKCIDCPYYGSCYVTQKFPFRVIFGDALALLKAQEPRVMTLDDLLAIYDAEEEHTWPYETPPFLYFEAQPNQEAPNGYHGWVAWRDIAWMLEEGYLYCNKDNYGKAWICWNRKPTDAQREATAWQ